jgi:hypothetical protein
VVSLTNTPAIYITPRPRVLIRISRFAKGNADAMKDDADTIDSIHSFIVVNGGMNSNASCEK